MYAHCQILGGINVVVARFETEEPLVRGADFRTGDVTDYGHHKRDLYTGTAVDGSVDGFIQRNYKTPAIEIIDKTTDHNIAQGYEHNGVRFHVEIHDQLNAMGLMLEMITGADRDWETN